MPRSAGPDRCRGLTTCQGPTGGLARCSDSPTRTFRPGFDQAVRAQLAQLFGPAAATPDALYVQDWSAERWTSPSSVQRLDDHSLFGHRLYQRPTLHGRLHWASTETATEHAGHIEGALASGERAALAVLAASSAANEPGIDIISAGT